MKLNDHAVVLEAYRRELEHALAAVELQRQAGEQLIERLAQCAELQGRLASELMRLVGSRQRQARKLNPADSLLLSTLLPELFEAFPGGMFSMPELRASSHPGLAAWVAAYDAGIETGLDPAKRLGHLLKRATGRTIEGLELTKVARVYVLKRATTR